nr:hypothetical protein Q903MT_gene2867 [Picea sitchensis]
MVWYQRGTIAFILGFLLIIDSKWPNGPKRSDPRGGSDLLFHTYRDTSILNKLTHQFFHSPYQFLLRILSHVIFLSCRLRSSIFQQSQALHFSLLIV